MLNVEDPRLDGDNLCREKKFIGGKEFICIRESHDTSIHQPVLRTRSVFQNFISEKPESDKHYFVRRYPSGTH